MYLRIGLLVGAISLLTACDDDSGSRIAGNVVEPSEVTLNFLQASNPVDNPLQPSDVILMNAIGANPGMTLDSLILPASDDYAAIPQDPNNPITAEKVALGQRLFHETGLATVPNNPLNVGTYSCASCHHAAAGFKPGIPQGIAEGGQGFGVAGTGRVLEPGFSHDADDPAFIPDALPIAVPASLNTAYQEVMLWNGQLGNMSGGVVNAGLSEEVLFTPDTPKAENRRGLAGLETESIAALDVHRMSVTNGSVLQTQPEYIALFEAAYPEGADDVLEQAGKAMAAYNRTVLSNQAPFQRWLRGEYSALSEQEKRGATLFFRDGGCAQCHQGPALSSVPGASASEMFFAIGFADFDVNDVQIHGVVDHDVTLGRGGFTGEASDNFKFKIPQLYNLADTEVYGHGASFRSLRDVVAYKNAAVPQKIMPLGSLDEKFQPLGLSNQDIDDITAFLENALRDPNLARYTPAALPSGNCLPNNDPLSRLDLDC